jgi:hypothetical protein
MEPEDQENKPLVENSGDRFDDFENFKNIKRKEFTNKNGQYYHRENGVDEGTAREEGFFASICLCLCPTIGWCQFITIISLVEIAVFIVECSIKGVNNSEFLAPDAHAMEMMGWQDSKKIKN